MAHNVCCDSYHIYNVTYIYYTIVLYWGQVCDVRNFLGPLLTDWASGCYIRCGRIGSPAF